MALIVWLQALEPHALWHFVFALLSWCGDGPLYFLLFPLLYWRKAPAVAIRYGYVVGLAVLLLTVMKAQTTTPRPFLVAPDQVAFWPARLAGFSWFPSQDALIAAYRRDPSFPSVHALCAAAGGVALVAPTPSLWGRVALRGPGARCRVAPCQRSGGLSGGEWNTASHGAAPAWRVAPQCAVHHAVGHARQSAARGAPPVAAGDAGTRRAVQHGRAAGASRPRLRRITPGIQG